MYNALYKGHDLSKSGFARSKASQLDAEDFRRVLRAFSFLLLVQQKNNLKSTTEAVAIIDDAGKLASVKLLSSELFLDDLLLAVPLLIKEGTDFRFIHKSIGEFFSAEFISHQPNSQKTINHILNSHLYGSFINTFDYLSEINPILFLREIVSFFAKAALSENSEIDDPYIRTVYFIAQGSVGIWPIDKYVKIRKNRRFLEIPSDNEFLLKVNTHGNFKGEEYVASVGIFDNLRRIPSKAWEAITVIPKDSIRKGYRVHDFDIDSLGSDFPVEKWIPLNSELVLRNADNSIIRGVLLEMLSMPLIFSSYKRIDKNHNRVRILDENACRSVLRQIQQEDETQTWLEGLIS